MIIAVASKGLNVAQSALDCESYMCYCVDRGVANACSNFPNPYVECNSLTDLFKNLQIDVVVAKSIPQKLEDACKTQNIETFAATEDEPYAAAVSYLNTANLAY